MDSRLFVKHKKSPSLVYQYNLCLGRLNENDFDETYVRECVKITASPNVTWQDITREIQDCSIGVKKSFYLDTVTTPYKYGIVSLMVEGFKSIARNQPYMPGTEPATIYLKYERLAKELVASRDFEAAGGYDRKDHKFMDYWPKD